MKNMKKIHKILGLFTLSTIILFSACEEVDNSYTGNGFVHFSDAAITVAESSTDIVTLNVLLADAPAATDIAISIDVSLTTLGVTQELVEGVDFEVLAPADLSSITIPAGENSAEIQIAVFDNTVEDSTKYITLTLAAAGDYIIGYPGSEIKKTAIITIADDDCAFLPDNWTGVPVGIETFEDGDGEFTASASWTLDNTYVDATDTRKRFLVQGLMSGIFSNWGETVTNGGTHYVILDFADPLNPTIELESVLGDPDGVGRNDFYAHTDGGAWGYYIELNPNKTSTFSTCNRSLSLHYLVDVSADNGTPNDQSTQCTYSVIFE